MSKSGACWVQVGRRFMVRSDIPGPRRHLTERSPQPADQARPGLAWGQPASADVR
ncbi:hypothetical protein AB1460_27725 [Parafrankia sp. FMc2]